MNANIEISQKEIENRIFTIRGMQVNRNMRRFPENFMFQLTKKNRIT